MRSKPGDHHIVGVIPAQSRDQASSVTFHLLCTVSLGPSGTLTRTQGTPTAPQGSFSQGCQTGTHGTGCCPSSALQPRAGAVVSERCECQAACPPGSPLNHGNCPLPPMRERPLSSSLQERGRGRGHAVPPERSEFPRAVISEDLTLIHMWACTKATM